MIRKLYIATAILLTAGLGYAQGPVTHLGRADSVRTAPKLAPQKAVTTKTSKDIDADGQLAELAKPEKTDESFFLLQSYPNLQTGKAKIEVTISKAGQANIYLMNYLGDKIKTIFTGQLNAGTNFLMFDSANLVDGLYYIITDINGRQYADKFLVERK